MLILKKLLYVIILPFLGINCELLSSLFYMDANTLNSGTLQEIIPPDECRDMPCLFGTSLENLTYDEVREILITHPLTRDSNFIFEPNRIAWEWSDRVEHLLLSEGFIGLSRFDDLNYIVFEGDRVSEIAITFGYSLEDIIAIFGNEFNVYPFADRGRGGTSYILQFPENEGWFEVLHQCEEPTFGPQTFVVGYLFFSHEIPYYVRQGALPIRWSGYETQIQDCSTFRPG